MRNIYTIGKPTDAQRSAFKQAKTKLGITEPMVFAPAVPGCDRVVIFGAANEDAMPDFACDWMIVFKSDPTDIEDVLAWYCGLRHDWRAAGPALWLERVMGRSGVTEVV